MNRTTVRSGALCCALLATTALASPALAQSAAPPRFQEVDSNGVDLISGRFVFELVEGSIGSGDGAVSLVRSESGGYGARDDWSGSLSPMSATQMQVRFRNHMEPFTLSGSTWAPDNANGARLTAGPDSYVYTAADGTTVTFGLAGEYSFGNCAAGPAECLVVRSVARPNGTTFAYDWTLEEQCLASEPGEPCSGGVVKIRKHKLSSSTGYSYTFDYPANVPLTDSSWNKTTGATFTNSVVPPPVNPTVVYTTISSSVQHIKDTNGRTWRITRNAADLITNVRNLASPAGDADDIAIAYDPNGIVTSVTRNGLATGYVRDPVSIPNKAKTTITNAANETTIVMADLLKGRVESVKDAAQRTTTFSYDSHSRPIRTTFPENNFVEVTYDQSPSGSRGNVVHTRRRDKANNAANDIVTTAAFDETCANVFTCNQPNSVTDARNNTTTFRYYPEHGGLKSVTSPAPTGTAVQPQSRYAYSSVHGEYRLTGTSACETLAGESDTSAAACLNGADEVKSSFGYDANGNLTSASTTGKGNFSGSSQAIVTATSNMTYTPYGDLETVDGPLPTADDKSYYRYDSARQLVGAIGPDPDGPLNPLRHRVQRIAYLADGRVSKVEAGTMLDPGSNLQTEFTSLQQTETTYDGSKRPVASKFSADGTTYAFTETKYDLAGRVDCVAQRMTLAITATADACQQAPGKPAGAEPDRITKTVYTAAGEVKEVWSAFGTADAAADVTTTYHPNGQPATVADGRDNVTSYAYDGHDRLWTTTYPSAAPHGVTSEQYGYDPAGNRTTITNRAGETTAFEYDALNRVTLKNRPGAELDISYTYDNFGRVKRARDTNAFWGGYRLNYTYDAFGRVTSEGNIPHGTRRFDYDLAGRRTRITHADGVYFDYDYHVTGDVKTIRENGVGLLATYEYDPGTAAGQLGAMTRILFGNGTSRSFAYNAGMQLQTLSMDIAGAGTLHDLTLAFSYNAAGQIVGNTRSNEIYSTNRHYNTNRPYLVNALNQYTQSGDLKPDYDARGNMISAGTATTYGYDSENRLVTAPNHNFGFDPVGRLNYSWNNNEGYDYEGQHLIVERSGTTGPIRRRYVHGPGLDAPIVWYEGSNLSDRRFLQADERGSVIAITNDSGAVIGTNNYDEYGIPGTANIGRFQYTGQMWMWELGMYHYKARIYSPTQGRFLQTDPIGYGDGMNMYGYVGGDPINSTDPTGKCRGGAVAISARAGARRSTVFTCSDGTEEWRSSGTLTWRNNNPGNIRPGPFADRHGAIGEAHGFAVFRSYHGPNGGFPALVSLMYTSTYQGLSIAQAITRFAPPKENNTAAYIESVADAINLPPTARLSDLSGRQMSVLINTIGRIEGWTTGTVRYEKNADGSVTVTAIVDVPGSRIRRSASDTLPPPPPPPPREKPKKPKATDGEFDW